MAVKTIELQPAADPWIATRAEGLRRLEEFVPHAGRAYAGSRNEDRGPGDRTNVSVLSPYIRRRLITEEEVSRAVVARTGLPGARKFIQEVCWRTYWKGALEWQPAVWNAYRTNVRAALAALEDSSDAREAYESAVRARTGIAPFDAWARELVDTGYIHNHARMWFASIWIFTLGLPWELGADFFLRHLLDGDPASNTLSWRWVAGLQTRGKTYLASRGNILRYTHGRLDPGDRLATRAPAVREALITAKSPPPLVPTPQPGTAVLLVHDDDMGVESLPLDGIDVRAWCALTARDELSPLPLAPHAGAFIDAAFADTERRGRERLGDLRIVSTGDAHAHAVELAEIARAAGTARIVTPYAPIGPVNTRLGELTPLVAANGVRLEPIVRSWDRSFWPHASKGFFALSDAIPRVFAQLRIGV